MRSKQKENPWKYIENAKQTLKNNAIKPVEFYTYSMYVKIAGNWGRMIVLEALGELMKYKVVKIKSRKDIDSYKDFVAKGNCKMRDYLNSGYNYLHLCMAYEEKLRYKISQTRFEYAVKIIK